MKVFIEKKCIPSENLKQVPISSMYSVKCALFWVDQYNGVVSLFTKILLINFWMRPRGNTEYEEDKNYLSKISN